MEMNNFRLSYTLLHIKMNLVLRPYRLIRRHNFAHKKELSLAYIVAFNYSFFFVLAVSVRGGLFGTISTLQWPVS